MSVLHAGKLNMRLFLLVGIGIYFFKKFITRWGTCALASIGFGSHFSPIDIQKIEY
jgi:hypothetical protein